GRVPGAVQIAFNAGYGFPGVPANGSVAAVPAGPVCPGHLCEGIMQLAIHLYEHPETVTAEGIKEAPKNFSDFFTLNRIRTF
ncbi:MAG TPA: hypothetical protein VHY59_08570, partial [Chthoniobacterales bacterium]|nr:hypothetical protein [Chthoniobacterales bacterium]